MYDWMNATIDDDSVCCILISSKINISYRNVNVLIIFLTLQLKRLIIPVEVVGESNNISF